MVPDTVMTFICITSDDSQHYPMRKVPRRKKKAEIFLTNKVKEREKEGKEKRKNLQKSLQLSCGTLENSSTITRPVDLPK